MTRAMCSRSKVSSDTGLPTRIDWRARAWNPSWRQSQIDGVEDVAGRQDHGTFDGIAQLAQVTWPRVRLHRLERAWTEPQTGTSLLLTEDTQVVLGQEWDVFGTFPQRGHHQIHHVQPIEQIFAKPPGPNLRFERSVRGRNQTDIGAALARLAEPLVGLIVEEAEQTGLCIGGELADFVEEQRPTLGFMDLPRHIRDRSGERAPFVAEQRARHQIARQRRTVDDHERRIGAGAVGAHPAREDVLPGPAFPPEEQHGIRRRRASGDLQEFEKHATL